MQNSVPDVPEWKLVAFAWLPIDRWNADNILSVATPANEGKQYCKICDKWVLSADGEKHVKAHVKQEKDRRETRKAEGLEKARENREASRRERKLARENYEAVEATRENDPKPKPVKPAKAEINSSVSKAGKADKKVVVELEKALKINGEGTLVSLSEGTGIDIAIIRKQIGHVPGIKAVGYVSTGKRGRPPVIYGLSTTTKEV